MTDKEKLHQILSSLWKNDDSVGKTYYNQALQDVQTAIDLQEEPKTDWLQELQEKLDSLSKEDFEKVMAKYSRYGSVDYDKLNTMLDESLSTETKESWNKRLGEETVSELLNTESMIESYKRRLISQANGVKNSPLIDMCLTSYKHGINETLDTLNLSNVQRNGKDWKEETVSEDLENAALEYATHYDKNWSEVKDGYIAENEVEVFKAGAKWQKGRIVANSINATIGLPYENKDGGYTHLIDVLRPLPVGNNKIAVIFKED